MHLQFKDNVLLKNYTTYFVGGPAKKLIEVQSVEELKTVLKILNEQDDRYIVIGKGSNLLFDDQGYDGTVIVNKINRIKWNETQVDVSSGYSFSLLGSQSARKGFSGLEFAAGIPGSVGGAIFMNAGAGQMETKDPLLKVTFLNEDGKLEDYNRKNLKFSYRKSPFQEMKGVIISALFDLKKYENPLKKVKSIIKQRIETQPYQSKSCGCIFQNLEYISAGRLIDDCGLKGLKIGGARVSDRHANFIVNDDNATCENILDLIKYIQTKVYISRNILLETEVRYIPYQEIKNSDKI